MLSRRTVILAARETTYGTDPAMTGTNAHLIFDVDLDIKGEVLQRDVLRDTLSPLPHVVGMKDCTLSFKTEIKGYGLSGTAASYTRENCVLYAGCGFNTGAIVGTTIEFSLVSQESLITSLSFIVDKDGNRHKILGARGSVKPNLEAGKFGVYEWEFQGMFDPVSAGTIHDISGISNAKPPIVYNSSFNIGGFSPVCSQAQIDLGNTVAKRVSLNATYGVAGFRITGRKPKISFDADAVVESSNPFWGDWAGNVVDTFGIQIGATAGNIVKFQGFLEYETLKYGDQDGVSKYDCVASLCSSDSNTQNDELKIIHV